jgi:hypothetical protein
MDLGFNRIELNDTVEKDLNGYTGFALEKQITENIKVYVHWLKLEKPLLVVMSNSDYIHQLELHPDVVRDMFTKHEEYEIFI